MHICWKHSALNATPTSDCPILNLANLTAPSGAFGALSALGVGEVLHFKKVS